MNLLHLDKATDECAFRVGFGLLTKPSVNDRSLRNPAVQTGTNERPLSALFDIPARAPSVGKRA
jgi:hypothetical protein